MSAGALSSNCLGFCPVRFLKRQFYVCLLICVLFSLLIFVDYRAFNDHPHQASTRVCGQFFDSLGPLPVAKSRVVPDLYVIDVDAIHILQDHCINSSVPSLPVSIMINEEHRGLIIDRSKFNVTYFTEMSDFFLLHSNPTRALLKIDFARFNEFMVPTDTWKLSEFLKRSRLIECLGLKTERDESDRERVLSPYIESNLAKLRDALINIKSIPFLNSGTLLGWYRECSIIPHTSDADFAVRYEDFNSNMTEYLENLDDFYLGYKLGRENDSLEFKMSAREQTSDYIDLFIMYEQDSDHLYTAGVGLDGRRIKWIIPKPREFCSGILQEKLFFVPCNVEETLKASYGNWKVDHPTRYYSWSDSGADAVPNGKFTEEEMKMYYIRYPE